MLRAFRRHPWLTAAFLAATTVALGFLVMAAMGLAGWRDRPDEGLRPWMTVGYIARAHGLDPREIDRAAGLPQPVDGRPFTLAEIAADRGVPVDEVIGQVHDAIRQLRRADEGE
jgi:hypothetical protein